MGDISKVIDIKNSDAATVISALKQKSVTVKSWEECLKDYEPSKHKVCSDQIGLKDKGAEKSSRISIGLEKLLCKRMSEFTFALPVKRVYSNVNDDDGKPNETKQAIVKALEGIYKNARIDSVNLKRALAYYASCEILTVWYAVKKQNSLYGFDSNYKLKCKTYSPMDGVKLYPLIDELDDMLAMSIEYTKKDSQNHEVIFFETYTDNRHYIWKQSLANGGWEEVLKEESEEGEESGEEITLMKIPAIYGYRNVPVYDGLTELRCEIEYTLSRNSNVIAYNSAPVLKISGGIKGKEDKGESRRIFRTENGGDVSYVSWSQAIEALKYHVDTMLKLYWMQAQMPDISFDNMKGLGNIGYDARQTMLTDAHLKIGDEAGVWIEYLERECNVIKAFLKKICPKEWVNEIDNIGVEHIITAFIQNDELSEINRRMKANGGKAIESQLESIERYGRSDNAQATLEQIQEEEKRTAESRATAFAIGEQTI